MCIYYNKTPDLHYAGEEHVFPAAIGGRQTLAKGYVSDEFNKHISKLEQDFFREGLPSMPRILLGPGKRGSRSEKKATKSKVHLITNPADESVLALGYTQLAKTYEIPHLVWNTVTRESSFSASKEHSGSDASASISQFKAQCENAEQLKIKILINPKIPPDMLLLGIERNIEENYNCFFAKNPDNEFEISVDKVKRIAAGIQFDKIHRTQKYLPRVHQTMIFKPEHLRIYGKIAFNFLAFIKGVEFVGQPAFDAIRNWIAQGGTNSFVKTDFKAANPLEGLGISMPLDAHVVYLVQDGQALFAKVFLYNTLGADILLSNQLATNYLTEGFICDWRKGEEYLLNEYVAGHLSRTLV
jgi:hypothetical protein